MAHPLAMDRTPFSPRLGAANAGGGGEADGAAACCAAAVQDATAIQATTIVAMRCFMGTPRGRSAGARRIAQSARPGFISRS
jgi:hypothetical protein